MSSRTIVYKTLNPDLTVDKVYCKRTYLKEMHSIAYSQFRVSGHWLAIETGRWNRRGRGRLLVEERLYPIIDMLLINIYFGSSYNFFS